jgi:[acyl-carrier-protein] S-malonyltransferase
VVISGEYEAIGRATDIASKMSFRRIVPLKVAGAYHSKLMADAGIAFEKFLRDVEFKDPNTNVISNVTADFVRSGKAAKALLAKQIVSPVLFEKCCERAVRGGVNKFFECGAGRVLGGLLKRTCPQVSVTSLDNMADFNL